MRQCILDCKVTIDGFGCYIAAIAHDENNPRGFEVVFILKQLTGFQLFGMLRERGQQLFRPLIPFCCAYGYFYIFTELVVLDKVYFYIHGWSAPSFYSDFIVKGYRFTCNVDIA